MKKLTPTDYKVDKLYPRVARAMAELLKNGLPVSAPAVFLKMGMLSDDNLKAWRCGKVPYLERVITGSLGKTNRMVRIISLHAHDLNLPPAPPHSAGPIKHDGRPLRFCKTGERVSRMPTNVFSVLVAPAGRRSRGPTRHMTSLGPESPKKVMEPTRQRRDRGRHCRHRLEERYGKDAMHSAEGSL